MATKEIGENLGTGIKVSGNIISELSEKIPTHIIALNELIKNSYDAGALSVSIEIDTRKNILRIIDNGEGMNRRDIDTLFHLSHSLKVYGEYNSQYKRYVQGAKGLGFLSVFKFGKKAEWRTKSDVGINSQLILIHSKNRII
jgi:HSP90 family molecular chaperone